MFEWPPKCEREWPTSLRRFIFQDYDAADELRRRRKNRKVWKKKIMLKLQPLAAPNARNRTMHVM